jgi:hypothetical protein
MECLSERDQRALSRGREKETELKKPEDEQNVVEQTSVGSLSPEITGRTGIESDLELNWQSGTSLTPSLQGWGDGNWN